MKTNPNDPMNVICSDEHIRNGDIQPGLTKREYFAAAALQGILNTTNSGAHLYFKDRNAEAAVKLADALIAELNKEAKE